MCYFWASFIVEGIMVMDVVATLILTSGMIYSSVPTRFSPPYLNQHS